MPEIGRQFQGVPGIVEGGERPADLPFRGGAHLTLPVDHVLHSTQGWLDHSTVEDFKDIRTRIDADDEGPPRVSHLGGKDWIFDGHHRIAADRLMGRPTEVLYHRARGN